MAPSKWKSVLQKEEKCFYLKGEKIEIDEWKLNNWKEIKGINQNQKTCKNKEMNELMKKKLPEENEN